MIRNDFIASVRLSVGFKNQKRGDFGGDSIELADNRTLSD